MDINRPGDCLGQRNKMEIIEKKLNGKKYILTLLLTLLIFGSGFFLSDYIAQKRIDQLNDLQQTLRTDILSLETQFSILAQAPCSNLNESTLTNELYEISQGLTTVGNTLGETHSRFLELKKYYSILEIKHWLLLQKTAKECKLPMTFIIYFYGDKKTCPKCEDQGYILTYFREKYPFLRIYSFDFDLELSALKTLKSVFKLKEETPIMVINNDVYYGYKSKEELETILEKYVNLETLEEKEAATSTSATSTKN